MLKIGQKIEFKMNKKIIEMYNTYIQTKHLQFFTFSF
jgi:hypothetical protein